MTDGFIDGFLGWLRLVLSQDVWQGDGGWYAFGFLWGAQCFYVASRLLGYLTGLAWLYWRQQRRSKAWRCRKCGQRNASWATTCGRCEDE